ncbi:hypothetical protein HK104_011391 [Borealophlyctis nickersoniae]|nr:hypothetical protein HK104_011391 [Borealophlyctis nickersoniae]
MERVLQQEHVPINLEPVPAIETVSASDSNEELSEMGTESAQSSYESEESGSVYDPEPDESGSASDDERPQSKGKTECAPNAKPVPKKDQKPANIWRRSTAPQEQKYQVNVGNRIEEAAEKVKPFLEKNRPLKGDKTRQQIEAMLRSIQRNQVQKYDRVHLKTLINDGRDDSNCQPTEDDDRKMRERAKFYHCIGSTTLCTDRDNHLFAAFLKGLNDDIKQGAREALEELVQVITPPKPGDKSRHRSNLSDEKRQVIWGVYHLVVWVSQGAQKPMPAICSECVKNFEAIQIFLWKIAALAERAAAILEAFEPGVYRKYELVFTEAIKNHPALKGLFANMPAMVFTGLAVLIRALSDPHRDRRDLRWGYCIVFVFGDFDSADFILYDAKLRFQLKPGDAIMIRSFALNHFVDQWERGDRYSMVFFSHWESFSMFGLKGGEDLTAEELKLFDLTAEERKRFAKWGITPTPDGAYVDSAGNIIRIREEEGNEGDDEGDDGKKKRKKAEERNEKRKKSAEKRKESGKKAGRKRKRKKGGNGGNAAKNCGNAAKRRKV